LVSDGAATFNSSITSNGQFIESKETVILNLTKTSATEASARLTLTSSSRKNIFVTLKATTAPTLNPVYDGVSAITAGIIVLSLYVDFDSANPPAPNSSFNIYVVDVTEEFSSTTIIPAVTSGGIPFVIEGGTNLNAAPTAPIILHDNISQVGTNPSSTVVGNNQLTQYGQNASLLYIVDQNSDDRLVITSLVGMEFF
jgi:hypothetical protein